MAIIAGAVSARIWRVTESLPPRFDEVFERNLQRHAFKPLNIEKGELRSIGWVNIRKLLDEQLKLDQVLYGNVIALGLRIDRIGVNLKMFRARLDQEIGKALRQKGTDRLSDEQRTALEDKLRLEMLRAQPPSMSVYEMAWHLETGLVLFSSTGNKINMDFSDLFAETFNVSLEPQFPYFRAHRMAKKQKLEHELREVLPSPFSPKAPIEVVEVEESHGNA